MQAQKSFFFIFSIDMEDILRQAINLSLHNPKIICSVEASILQSKLEETYSILYSVFLEKHFS